MQVLGEEKILPQVPSSKAHQYRSKIEGEEPQLDTMELAIILIRLEISENSKQRRQRRRNF